MGVAAVAASEEGEESDSMRVHGDFRAIPGPDGLEAIVQIRDDSDEWTYVCSVRRGNKLSMDNVLATAQSIIDALEFSDFTVE